MLPCLVILRRSLFPTSSSSQRHFCAHPKACRSLPSVGCQLSAVSSRTSPFPVTLARNTRGSQPSSQIFSSLNLPTRHSLLSFTIPISATTTLRSPRRHPFLTVRSSRITVHGTRATLPPSTHHSPPATIPFTMRTFAKHASNPCRMRSFKTQDLKSFRMCSSEKTRGGVPLLFATASLLKPLLQLAHPYTCTCKKGPAAREPRY